MFCRAYLILNRATDARSSCATLESSRTCCAVVRVPSVACSVTEKIFWMLPAIALACSASSLVAAEMLWIRLDNCWDTRSISPSVWPALSERVAP